jgi:hypothetical protein
VAGRSGAALGIEVIKAIAWLSLAGSTFLFILGLIDPAIRPFYP